MVKITIVHALFAYANRIFVFKTCVMIDGPGISYSLSEVECQAVNKRQFIMTIFMIFLSAFSFVCEISNYVILVKSIDRVSFFVKEMSRQNEEDGTSL